MKLHAAVKVGLIGGLVASLSLELTALPLYYAAAYNFKISTGAVTLLTVLGWPLMLATILGLGPLAVRKAGEAAQGWREAALVGGGAGLVTGLVSYLIVGALASIMVLGVVPLIVPLSDPSSIASTGVDNLLRPIVQFATVQVYVIQLGFMGSWTVAGAVGGVSLALVRQIVERKRDRREAAAVGS